MKFGVVLFNKGPLANGANLAAMAQRAEALGYEHVAVTEHLVIPKREGEQDQYRSVKPSQQGLSQTERKGWEALRNYHEPLLTLMYLAGCTTSIRVGTSVMILPYRNPLVTAKMLSTLDVLSGGRAFCGIGAGWWQDEFAALGLADQFKLRGSRTDEALRIFRNLWTEETSSFEGRFNTYQDLEFSPKPLQQPFPIWVGGNSERSMKRAAALGDAWHPLALKHPGQMEPDAIAAARAELDRHTVAAGRHAGSVQLALRCAVRRVGEEKAPLDEAVEALRVLCVRYAAAGVDSMTLDIPGGSWQEAMDCLEAVGQRILPGLA